MKKSDGTGVPSSFTASSFMTASQRRRRRPDTHHHHQHHRHHDNDDEPTDRRRAMLLLVSGVFSGLLLLLLLLPSVWTVIRYTTTTERPDDEVTRTLLAAWVTSRHHYRGHAGGVGGGDDDHNNKSHDQRRYAVDASTSHNDPALEGLRQAACTVFWAPSSSHGDDDGVRMGVYTARDVPRKAVGQPFPDACARLRLPPDDDRRTEIPRHAVTSTTTTDDDDHTVVLCQGFAALFDHAPDDHTRAATSYVVPTASHGHHDDRDDDGVLFHVHTLTHHKVRAGAALTVDYRRAHAPPSPSSVNATTTTTPSARDPEWLRRHGRCLDHVRLLSSSSSVGAVARRRLHAGDVVTVSPVTPLPRIVVDDAPDPRVRRFCVRNATTHDDDDSYNYFFAHGPGLGYLGRSHDHDDDDNATTSSVNVALRWEGSWVQVIALRDVRRDEPLVVATAADSDVLTVPSVWQPPDARRRRRHRDSVG